MIVCSCNAIRERELRVAARETSGRADVEAVYARLGCEVNCGQCLPFAAQIIDEEICVTA